MDKILKCDFILSDFAKRHKIHQTKRFILVKCEILNYCGRWDHLFRGERRFHRRNNINASVHGTGNSSTKKAFKPEKITRALKTLKYRCQNGTTRSS